MSNKQWKPGQRLNTAAEALRALADGEKLAATIWEQDNYIYMDAEGSIVNQDRKPYIEFSWTGYRIYSPPKRKVKSERWFAVLPGTVHADKTFWVPYWTETDARNDHPNALAYHCATVEVEVDDET